MKKILIVISFVLFSLTGFAKHIVGGEIYYDCRGNDMYRITLKLYRDCYGGGAGFDNPAFIGIFSSGKLIQELRVHLGSAHQLNYLPTPCMLPPTDICVEEGIYDTIIILPSRPGGYDISYQRCCRNASIVNIGNVDETGATYMCHIPDPALAKCNSSPRFKEFPPIFLCQNQPLTFDHSATDPDGDSLVYSFANPYQGGTFTNPMPQPPDPPPYPFITFIPPYSPQHPLSALPALSINSITGLLTGTPNKIGRWAVGVSVKEYRNGKLLSQNVRDFQFNVIVCPALPSASIPAQTTFCAGMKVDFLNNSINASSYHWDFGDASVTNDTSDRKTPSWIYAQPGIYRVMLVISPGTLCADTAYTTFTVKPLLAPSFVAGPEQCFKNNKFSFKAGGVFQGNGTMFLWDFGPKAVPSIAMSRNVSAVNFKMPGAHPVTLKMSENGCLKSFTDTVSIHPEPDLTYHPPALTHCGPFTVNFSDSTFRDSSLSSVLWNFGDGIFSTQFNPVHTYTATGVYNVQVAITTGNYCLNKNMIFSVPNMISVFPVPVAGLKADPLLLTILDSNVTFTDLSKDAMNCKIYFGDGDSANSCSGTHIYPRSGEYTVTQVVENQYGCKDRFSLNVDVDLDPLVWIPNAFTPNQDENNDYFAPVATGIQNYQMTIFDKWGSLIYKTNALQKGWDGSFHQNPCQEGIYVWKIEFENSGKHHLHHKLTGHVALIR